MKNTYQIEQHKPFLTESEIDRIVFNLERMTAAQKEIYLKEITDLPATMRPDFLAIYNQIASNEQQEQIRRHTNRRTDTLTDEQTRALILFVLITGVGAALVYIACAAVAALASSVAAFFAEHGVLLLGVCVFVCLFVAFVAWLFATPNNEQSSRFNNKRGCKVTVKVEIEDD